MVFVRKRYYIWLIKAYFKRWKRPILMSILLGGFLFFAILIIFSIYIQPKIERKTEKIGIVGAYSLKELPEDIVNNISYGLTTTSNKGEIIPGAAERWTIQDDGRTYIFYLRKNLKYHDGEELTSNNLDLNFKDVKRKNINTYTISYTLKNAYSPFLTTVSKPILKKNYAGLGEYKIIKIDLNAGFVKSIYLQNVKDNGLRKNIYFYPTLDSLKVAFSLGEVDKAIGLNDLQMKDTNFKNWKNISVIKSINYKKLVVLFYNNNDQQLSDKKLRQALNYALPSEYYQGEAAFSPILPGTIYYNKLENYSVKDIEIAKTLLSSRINNEKIKLEISTTKDYQDVAQNIKNSWDKLGCDVRIKIVDEIPSKFQILLYSFRVPKDPDQYTLWHTDQPNNISRYDNKRIDKLLEDGRTKDKINERIKIYSDFQKYLLDDTPVSFLYFPYQYSLERTI